MNYINHIKILIIDDEVLIAEDIKEICEEAGYEVSKICYRASQALLAIDQEDFDLVIIDINLEDEMSGLEIASYIKQKKFSLPFIFLTSYSDNITLNVAKALQPIGFVVKPFQKEQLISTIEISMANYNKFHHAALLSVDALESKYHIIFTSREKQIIPLLCSGQTNEQIAQKIYLSINTIKFHVKSIYDKLGVNNRSQLILAMTN